jgi:hypothetical protein
MYYCATIQEPGPLLAMSQHAKAWWALEKGGVFPAQAMIAIMTINSRFLFLQFYLN